MSGTDYTQTATYGLYKPTPNADGDAWGGHWNSNADALDALILSTNNSLGNYLPISQRGVPNGVATLGPTGIVPTAQLPVTPGALTYLGGWNPSTNTPVLASGALAGGVRQANGCYYLATVSGTTAAIDGNTTWGAGDWVVSNGTTWQRAQVGTGAYLPLTGGTLGGALTLSGNATLPLHAVPLQQLNSAVAGAPFLPLIGGTVTGATTHTAAMTLSGAGTGLSVTNNATVGGTLTAPTIKGPTGGTVSIQPATNTGIVQFNDLANGASSNYLQFRNGATGTGPTIRVLGVDGNSNINYQANGTGIHAFTAQVAATSLKAQQTITLSGSSQATTQYGLYGNITVTGSIAGAVSSSFFGITDLADASGAPDGTLRGFRQNHNLAAGFKGGRYAAEFDLSVSAANGSSTAGQKQYAGVFHNVVASANDGGSALTNGAPAGGLTATNSFVTLAAGATFWQYMTGHEIDIVCQAGASVYAKTGLAIVQQNTDAVNGAAYDAALGINAQGGATVRWLTGFAFGGVGGAWPIHATAGRIMSIYPQQFTSTPGTAFRLPQALHGIDLSLVEFAGNAFASPNFTVTGAGAVNLGVGSITASGTTVSIDAGRKYVSAATVSSGGGTSNVVGDRLYGTDGYGDIYSVATVSGPGAVLTVNIVSPGSASGSPAANVTTIGGSGGGQAVVLTRTWTAGTTLSLNPTGKQLLTNLVAAATDAAAASAGVPINGLYNNAGVVHVRLA